VRDLSEKPLAQGATKPRLWPEWRKAPPSRTMSAQASTLLSSGILLCYGLVGPIAANMGKVADEERAYLNVLKVLIVCFLKGTAPIMAVEAARRAIPGHVRPTFTELEQACRGGGASSTATPEAPGSEAPAAESASSGG